MNDENPSIPPLLSGNEVLSPVIDMGESKDRGGEGFAARDLSRIVL